MPDNGLYIQMFSIHGLVRSENMELGYDADTGGQVKYVIELGKALAKHENIRRIDLFTRLISDKSFSEDYSISVEQVDENFRIVRIQCGGLKYIRKELLWPYLDEFVDKTIKFIKREASMPDIVHGHYADGGYIAKELSRIFGIPFIFTGHSLGRSKKARLLGQGYNEEELNKQIKMDHRIETEEQILKYADMVVASTLQEVQEQYAAYRNSQLTQYQVIPPGIGVNKFQPFYYDNLPEEHRTEEALFAKASVLNELSRFLKSPDKPMILMLCRPDKRKNIEGLIKAYGEDYDLQAIANLVLFAGIRKDISEKEDGARDVLTQMLLLMDKYNLYGKMAIPKKHDFEIEVPELYRIAAERRGVFVNPALTEPFGITLLEASATGLPIVATKDGGPKDILKNCKSGVLVDPLDTRAISRAIRDILVHEEKWEEYSKNGIMNTRKHYTWESHSRTYMKKIEIVHKKYDFSYMKVAEPGTSIGKRLANLKHMIITDIDNTLIGGENEFLQELLTLLKNNRDCIGFAVATGRVLESAVKILKDHDVVDPDIIISSVGSEIYYGQGLHNEKGWKTHISKNWNHDKIASLLKKIDFIEPQENAVQRAHKISYNMEPGKDRLAKIHNLLTRNRCHYNLIYSHEKYLDVLPYRASKGKAIRYLSYKWEIPLKNFLVCGDSGNDEEMLTGEPAAVVVGNYSKELENIKSRKNVYFAKQHFAGGMIEGIKHYHFIEKARQSKNYEK